MNIAIESHFLIKPIPGFAPHLGHLVLMMNFVRITTLGTVEGLSTEQLDYLMDDQSNSIGMLLAHIAALEVEYQIMTFENRQPTEDEKQSLKAALALGKQGRQQIKGHDLAYYLTNLEQVRNKTLQEFANRDDAWLYQETTWWGGHKGNNYFKWFHVFEDELNHRGQMRMIRKRLPSIREL